MTLTDALHRYADEVNDGEPRAEALWTVLDELSAKIGDAAEFGTVARGFLERVNADQQAELLDR